MLSAHLSKEQRSSVVGVDCLPSRRPIFLQKNYKNLMSSVASQRALLLALGGVSIAALFVWYIEARKKAEKEKEKKRVKHEISAEPPIANGSTGTPSTKLESKNGTTSNSSSIPDVKVAHDPVETMVSPCDPSSAETADAEPSATESEPPSDPIMTVNKAPSLIAVATSDMKASAEVSDADSEHAVSSGGQSVSEGDYEMDQVCEKTNELMLDCSHVAAEQGAFSWSEEMERSYAESVALNASGQGDSLAHKDVAGDVDGYANSESPGMVSQNSEVSSQDSGRATGGLASSLSPMDDINDGLPMYEFEIPNSLVGLIIGVKGKTIIELSKRTAVRMMIRQHHTPEKADSHQICQVRGKRDQINRCLQMLRRRFPPARFPELNLQPVLPPPLPNNLFDAMTTQPSWLTLPENIPCEVACSSVINAGHFFLQQPTHPSFSSLTHLDMYMLRLYTQGGSIPELPKPCQNGLLCAAPVLDAWFRAVTVCFFEETDEVLVRFVDYGGYTKIPRGDLRQIRTDLMTLPFQANECYLAHVQPIDGTWQWNEDSMTFFQNHCMGKVVNATVVGHHVDEKVPMVEITFEENGKAMRLDRALMEAGVAKASDPSKMIRATQTKRPSLMSQNSQTAQVAA